MKYINLSKLQNGEIVIESHSNIFDLHNDADFSELVYNVLEKKAVLIWNYPSRRFINDSNSWYNEKYLEIHRINEKKTRQIALIFDFVTCLDIKGRDIQMPFTEDTCLSNIIIEEPNNNTITFEFVSEMEVKIESQYITFFDNYF